VPVATLRLTAAEKRRFTAEARRRGLSLSEYLRRAGHAEASRVDWKAFLAATPSAALPAHAPTDLSTREGFGG
jgi:Mobilization protein NikA